MSAPYSGLSRPFSVQIFTRGEYIYRLNQYGKVYKSARGLFKNKEKFVGMIRRVLQGVEEAHEVSVDQRTWHPAGQGLSPAIDKLIQLAATAKKH